MPIIRERRLAAVVLCLGLAGCAAVAPPAATKSAEPSPEQRVLAKLGALAEREPTHAGAFYLAAKFAARTGDEALASSWLDRLERLGLGDQLEPTDFGDFAKTPAFRERAERFARAAPPIGNARLWTETRCADLLPEGTAWDARRRELLISSGRQRNVYAIDAAGGCRKILATPDARLLAVLGMSVDAASDTLWVATSAAPFMVDAAPADTGASTLARIDLATGKVIAAHRLDGGVMLNDLAIAPDGAVYVTEAAGGRIYRLRSGATALEPIVAAATFEGPNGIAVLDGGDLLIADFHGLSRIASPSSAQPAVTRLETPGRLYLGGIDGLARSGARIVGIQNLVGRSRIWSLTMDPAAPRVADARILLRAHPDFMNPTTGVIVGDRFLFVADPNVQAALPSGELTALPPQRTGHRVLELLL